MEWLAMLGILSGAALAGSALGFGEVLLAVPLLGLFVPLEVAVPVSVLGSVTLSGIVALQDWRQMHFRSIGWLLLSSLVGIPLGLWLLVAANEHWVKGILALVIIAFSLFSLLQRTPLRLEHDRLAWLFGGIAGVLGGAYGMNGPPLVVYGALRSWDPQRFRATLQGYFLPTGVLVMAGYMMAGLWTQTVSAYYLLSLSTIAGATLWGRRLNRRLSGERFIFYIHLGLIGIGLLLLFQILWT